MGGLVRLAVCMIGRGNLLRLTFFVLVDAHRRGEGREVGQVPFLSRSNVFCECEWYDVRFRQRKGRAGPSRRTALWRVVRPLSHLVQLPLRLARRQLQRNLDLVDLVIVAARHSGGLPHLRRRAVELERLVQVDRVEEPFERLAERDALLRGPEQRVVEQLHRQGHLGLLKFRQEILELLELLLELRLPVAPLTPTPPVEEQHEDQQQRESSNGGAGHNSLVRKRLHGECTNGSADVSATRRWWPRWCRWCWWQRWQ